jgi:hypothetical protein
VRIPCPNGVSERRRLFAFAALLAACESSESPNAPSADALEPATAVIHAKQRVEIIVDDVFLNECGGELMDFHFNELMILHDLEIVGKAFHSHLIQVDRGSYGVGLTTGARYRQTGKQGGTFFISTKIDEVQTFVSTVQLIGTAGAPSARGTLKFHITVGLSGLGNVEFQKARFTCR